ncbi:hypothetical protein ACERK3_19285 [Phycisphaerales bacterium AB-hyl4]|uniref:Uncharacterized protein n=1 Tax=Natronomicrosphaera hydrolytica TaxID=3242702 RepID=A0ABV4U9Y9_9BACT
MRIDLRNEQRDRLFTVYVDLEDPPAVVRPPNAVGGSKAHLDWDRALDDERHLRRCPVCGCPDLFLRKQMPQVTGFVLIILAAVVAMVLLGIGEVGLAVLILVLVGAVDVAIYFFTRRVLVCYRCRSEFSGMPMSRRHGKWEKTTGEKYPPPRPRTTPPPPASDEADAETHETLSR